MVTVLPSPDANEESEWFALLPAVIELSSVRLERADVVKHAALRVLRRTPFALPEYLARDSHVV